MNYKRERERRKRSLVKTRTTHKSLEYTDLRRNRREEKKKNGEKNESE